MRSFFAFSPFATSAPRLLACALVGPIVALGALASLIGQHSLVAIVVVAVITMLALAPLVPQRIVVGPSSLRRTWLSGTQEIPFERIASFDALVGGFAAFVLVTLDGVRTQILPVGWGPGVLRAREASAPLTTYLAQRHASTRPPTP